MAFFFFKGRLQICCWGLFKLISTISNLKFIHVHFFTESMFEKVSFSLILIFYNLQGISFLFQRILTFVKSRITERKINSVRGKQQNKLTAFATDKRNSGLFFYVCLFHGGAEKFIIHMQILSSLILLIL